MPCHFNWHKTGLYGNLNIVIMATNEIQDEWIPLTEEDIKVIETQKLLAKASPGLFMLKSDNNNASGAFADMDEAAVLHAAKESVSYLKQIGFIK